jgi:hypothetical protein
MNNFIEIPATKISFSRRRPIYAIGINDADYMVSPIVNGKKAWCPFYATWSSMLSRSYSKKTHERLPTYLGCSVSSEWLLFSVFKEWMIKKDWKGKQLDKDILIPGNKVYGPNSCIFVSQAINSLLSDSAAIRGAHPQGVCFEKRRRKYQAGCKVNGNQKFLGYFETSNEAERTYLKFKAALISKAARGEEAEKDPDLKSALLAHSAIFSNKASKIEVRL